MSVDARTIGEEILGAEIIAGKELTEATGNYFEALEKGGSILRQQAGWWLSDYTDFWLKSLRFPPDPGLVVELFQRRSEHVLQGVKEAGELMDRECAPLTRMWSDFFGVVKKDWRRS
jgi:hypothetical protein